MSPDKTSIKSISISADTVVIDHVVTCHVTNYQVSNLQSDMFLLSYGQVISCDKIKTLYLQQQLTTRYY